MKRFLSIILALALVISMVPATFATGEVKTELKYVFSREAVGKPTEKTVAFDSATYDTIVDSLSDKYAYIGARSLASGALRANNANYAVRIGNIGNGANGLVFKLQVPNFGVYTPSFAFYPYISGAQATLYLVKDTYAETKNWNMADGGGSGGIKSAIADAEKEDSEVITVGNIETFSENGNAKVRKVDELKEIELAGGEYYFIIYLSGVNEDATQLAATTNPYNEIWFDSFNLTRQPYVKISAEAGEVEIENSISVVGKAFKADDSDAGSVTYSVSPADVASVTSDGTVTGLKAGTATITAKATIGEKEYTDSVDVKVNPIDKTQKFVFGTSALSEATIAAATKAGKCNDSGLLTTSRDNNGVESGLEYFDEYADMAVSDGKSTWAYSHMGGATIYLYPNYATLYVGRARYGNAGYTSGGGTTPYLDTRYVFKLKVKNAGTYDITADMINSTIGTEADVYFVKASDVESSSLIKLDAKGNRYRMTMDYIKTLPVDGRIGNIGANNSKSTQFVCTKQLEATDYYMILHLNTDHKEMASNKKQTLTISGITLKESDGSIVNPETPVNAKANVSFATNIDGTIATDSVARGTSVSISAPETDKAGNKFKCWVRGTEANGVWVSSKANDTFKVMTNTYLTAVYEAPAAEGGKVVEFYNENGQYIETVAAVDGKAVFPTTKPSLTGYDFAGWYTDEETELKEGAELSSDVTYAVAKYTAKQVIGTIENDNVKVNGTASTEYKFGAPISGNDNKAKYWLRNGKIVKFGTSYEYLVWDGANIMSSYDTTTAIRPTVVIDTTSVDGAYMIEYDKGNKSIAEVGILFGNSEKITVDSCKYKATSQWNRDHGQFMAKPYGDTSESFARGYLIYNDGGSYKVIYTDAIEIQ